MRDWIKENRDIAIVLKTIVATILVLVVKWYGFKAWLGWDKVGSIDLLKTCTVSKAGKLSCTKVTLPLLRSGSIGWRVP